MGTHWCGAGGAGPPVNELDAACKAHDKCYDAHGLTIGDNWLHYDEQKKVPGKMEALKKCNKQLCDATAKMKGLNPWLVHAYFYEFGDGNVDSQEHTPVSRPHPFDWRHPFKTMF